MPAGKGHRIDPDRTGRWTSWITTPGHLVLVKIQRSERLGIRPGHCKRTPRADPPDPGNPQWRAVCRELWLYSRYATLRFFRIENSALIELGADGTPLPARTGNGEIPMSGKG